MYKPFYATCLLCAMLVAACATPDPPALDKQALLDRQTWWDNQDWAWYKTHIPFFESPDAEVDATYYYRWEVLTKHLIYGSPETGYTFTEFIDRPFWSGTYGGISCPLGHQFYEVRWLKNRRIIDDFARYWFETPGAQPRSYSNWYGDAMWATYQVLGDPAFISTVLPHMESQYQGWIEEHFDPNHGMFRWDGMHDGMETNINSRQTVDTFAGAEGYRPTLNSYLFADLLALSKSAALLGDSAKATTYGEQAAVLKQRVQDELWDPERQFFFHQFAHDEKDGIKAKSLTYETGPYAGNPHGRELIGYVPWQFNLPDPGYEAAWQFLMDPDYFFAPYGPSTVERNDPLFHISPRCCVWSGNAWPYATTQTLAAFANLLNNYEQDVVTKDDYVKLLRIYSLSHRMDGRPYIAEAAHPDDGSWDGHNHYYHSEHYLHSGYIDLIITGLAGLRPQDGNSLVVNPLIPDDWAYFALDDVSYQGHRLSIFWDRDGTRYGHGTGLMVFVDGEKVAQAETIQKLSIPLSPTSLPEPARRLHNFAVNNGHQPYPLITASYSHPNMPPFYANDGNYWYHASPPNRWSSLGSGQAQDTLTVDLGIERPLETIKLYFLDEEGVTPPAQYDVHYWKDEAWQSIPNQERYPAHTTGRRANTVSFSPLQTAKVRVLLTHQPGSASGLTELEAWGDADLPLALIPHTSPNLAFNADSTGYPRISASYTSPYDDVRQINDMQIAFTRYSRNRWTAFESPYARDWVEVDFGEPKSVRQIDLYLWGHQQVQAPEQIGVQYWHDNQWTEATNLVQHPEQPTVEALNTISIVPVTTTKLRVLFDHAKDSFTGVSEMMIWEN